MARKPKPVSKDIPAVLIDTGDPVVAEREYAEAIPGWALLPAKTRQAIIDKTVAVHARPHPPRIKAGKDEYGGLVLGALKDQDPTLMALELAEAFGVNSLDFANARLADMAKWFLAGEARGEGFEFQAGLAFVHGCQPKTPVEAMLATQMVMTNSAALRALSRADRADTFEAKQVLGNQAIKLLRTFTAQAEALAKIQRGGEQVVKHIHVDNRGGQAIVTDTVVTGGVNGKDGGQPYDQRTLGPALLGSDPFGHGMPIAGNERQEAVPAARRTIPRRA